MLEAIKYSPTGEKIGTISLDENIFSVSTKNKKALLYEVINMYLNNQRQSNAAVKSRSDVRGTTAKMYRQKGTGNARAGSRRSPIRVGGGIAFGPKPKDRYKSIPKRKKRLALKIALTEKAAAGKVLIIESINFDKPSTAKAFDLINSIIPDKGKKLLVTEDSNLNIIRSFTNINDVETDRVDSLFAYEVMRASYVVLTEKALASMPYFYSAPKGRVGSAQGGTE